MLSVTFLGTSAARPTVERNVSAMALMREGETLLFECGEGTQRQMMRYGVSFALSEIFFTHFHADHFLGVIGLIRTLGPQVPDGAPHGSERAAREVFNGKGFLGTGSGSPSATKRRSRFGRPAPRSLLPAPLYSRHAFSDLPGNLGSATNCRAQRLRDGSHARRRDAAVRVW